MLLVALVLLQSSDMLIPDPCVPIAHLLPMLLTVAPSLPSSAWSLPRLRAPSEAPSEAHQFVWEGLVFPEALLGFTTELQRDLWPVFGFSPNFPTLDMA